MVMGKYGTEDEKVIRCARNLCGNTFDAEARAELLAILDMGPKLEGAGVAGYALIHKLVEDGYPLDGYGIASEEKKGVYRRICFHNWTTDESFSVYIDDEPLRPDVFFGFTDRHGQVSRVKSIIEAVAAS